MSDITKKAIVKYQVAIDKNTSESEVLWSRYSAMLVFNSILIAAIGLSYQDNINLPKNIYLFLPIAGLIFCFVWGFTTFKGFRWINRWIISARKLEDKYLKDDNPKSDPYLNPVLNGYANYKPLKKICGTEIGQTEIAAYTLILLTAIIYVLFLIHPSSFLHSYKHSKKTIYFNHNYNDGMVRDRRFPK